MTDVADHADALLELADACARLPADRAHWAIEPEGDDQRLDVFVVLNNPRLAKQMVQLMREGQTGKWTTTATDVFLRKDE